MRVVAVLALQAHVFEVNFVVFSVCGSSELHGELLPRPNLNRVEQPVYLWGCVEHIVVVSAYLELEWQSARLIRFQVVVFRFNFSTRADDV